MKPSSRLSPVARRTLLRGAAGSLAALPFFSGLLSTVAQSQEAPPPLRLFVMFTGNGQHPNHWIPSGNETNFTLAPVLQPLEPHLSDLLMVHGMRGSDGHSGGMSECLTGRPSPSGDAVPTGGPSIDQLLAEGWRGQSPLASLELGVRPANDTVDHITYSASGLPIPPIGSPIGAFDKLFGLTNEDPTQAEQRRARQRSVLDSIASDLVGLQGQLGAPSRTLLDEHLTLLRQRETELQKPYQPLSCTIQPNPGPGAGIVKDWKDQNDNILSAFRCGVTRVATLRAGGWGGIEDGDWYNEVGVRAGHHNADHGGSADPYNDLLGINRFHAQQMAYLVDGLAKIPVAGGRLLDYTLVVWMNELGLGDFNHHSRKDVHVVLAGGNKTGLKTTGRYVQLANEPYHNFLVTMAQALGRGDVTSFGDEGTRAISQLFA